MQSLLEYITKSTIEPFLSNKYATFESEKFE